MQDVAWAWFGRALAIANFVYFNINMFCFIIPRFIPRAFQRYNEAKAAAPSAVPAATAAAKPTTSASTASPGEGAEKKKVK
jgi:hypothetical protein